MKKTKRSKKSRSWVIKQHRDHFFKKSKSKKFKGLKLPIFNKAIDDRFNKKKWFDLKNKPDVIIFEGWCVGAKSENNITLNLSLIHI